MDIIPQTKLCGGCGWTKPVDQFSRNKVKSDGLQNQCKACMAEYQKRYVELIGKEVRNGYQKRWIANNPGGVKRITDRYYARHRNRIIARYVYRNAVRKAAMRSSSHVPFTQKQLADKIRYWGDRCWMCRGPWTAIDHVKPLSKGGPHVLANLRPICKPCNTSKGSRWPLT